MTKSSSGPLSIPPSVITVLAPAKVNLILRILDRRPDGFHNVWSIMQTVGLEDEVRIRLSRDHSEIRLQCDAQSLSADRTNLVYRAAEAVLQQSERAGGLDIALTKRIPMGAGLGGGSSDAAATIIGLNRLLNLGWSQEKMATVGQALGSDVPFFFFAPSAVVSGRGEQVKVIRMSEPRWILLVNPGFPVETKWAYHQLSTSRSNVQPLSDSLMAIENQCHISWDRVLKLAENDFESPVFKAYPVLAEIKAKLLEEGAEAALLSGSGATVFGVFGDEAHAKQSAVRFQANPRLKVFCIPAGSAPLRCRP